MRDDERWLTVGIQGHAPTEDSVLSGMKQQRVEEVPANVEVLMNVQSSTSVLDCAHGDAKPVWEGPPWKGPGRVGKYGLWHEPTVSALSQGA